MSEKKVSFNTNTNKIIYYDPNIPINKSLFLWNHKFIILICGIIILIIFIFINDLR